LLARGGTRDVSVWCCIRARFVYSVGHMKLHEFIEQVGDESAAIIFGVKVRTAKSWRLQDRTPRPTQAREIVKITKGKVSLEEIFAEARQVA
jgi:hypothetical protein